MVTARIAGLSPGTSPPPVRIPIRPFLVLMRPLCRFLRACKRKIDGSDWMCKRHRPEPPVSLGRLGFEMRRLLFSVSRARTRKRAQADRLSPYHKPVTMHEYLLPPTT